MPGRNGECLSPDSTVARWQDLRGSAEGVNVAETMADLRPGLALGTEEVRPFAQGSGRT